MKKIIKLTESDLTKIVKRVMKEQFAGEFRRSEPSYEPDEFEMRIKDTRNSQLRDIINNFESIDCEGINHMSAESLYGERPERDIIYCTSYRGKSKEDLIGLLGESKKRNKLTESDSTKIVKRVIEEQNLSEQTPLGVAYNIGEIGIDVVKLIVNVFPPQTTLGLIWDLITGNKTSALSTLKSHEKQLGDKYQTLVNTINKGDLAKLARQIKDVLGSII